MEMRRGSHYNPLHEWRYRLPTCIHITNSPGNVQTDKIENSMHDLFHLCLNQLRPYGPFKRSRAGVWLACYRGEGFLRPKLSLPLIMPRYGFGARTLAVTILTYYWTITVAIGVIFSSSFCYPIPIRHTSIHFK